MNRITLADLNGTVARINRVTKSPEQPYIKTADENYTAQIGNYHLSRAYGGYSLQRMENLSGGISDALRSGHIPKRDLHERMQAFLAGIAAHELSRAS